MGDYYYRGTSLTAASEQELATGEVSGFTTTLYKGEFRSQYPDAAVARETPVRDLPWWTPEGHEGTGYITETQPVTGGLTNTLGTAVGFARGIPLVFYIDQSAVRGGPVQYRKDYFDAQPGALAWVYGDNISGEVRSPQGDLYGLVSETSTGPVVWRWGVDQLRTDARQYQDEREVIALTDAISLPRTASAVALVFEGPRTPQTVLANLDGYHAGWGDEDEVDVTRWSDEEVLAELHAIVRNSGEYVPPRIYSVGLGVRLMEKFANIPLDGVSFTYDGQELVDGPDGVPEWVFGPDGGM